MSLEPAVKVVVLAPPAPEAVAEAADVGECSRWHQDNASDIAGVGQPVTPPGHGHRQVENLLDIELMAREKNSSSF